MSYNTKNYDSSEIKIELVNGGFIVNKQYLYNGVWNYSRTVFITLDEVIEFLKEYYIKTEG